MPWEIRKKGNKYCVYKKGGSEVKCHSDEEKAKAHLRALYANEKKTEKSMDPDTMAIKLARIQMETRGLVQSTELATGDTGVETFIPTSSGTIVHAQNVYFSSPPNLPEAEPENNQFAPIRLYFREGEKTPDGRVIDPNAVNFNRPPPYSITLQTVRAEGHAGAVVCGVITKIVRDGLAIVCDGFLDLTTMAGREAFNLINNRTMQTWSPDLGDAVVDYEQNVSDEDANEATHLDELAHFVSATFLGATLVAMPALASAVVELLDASGNVLVPAPSRGAPAEPDPAPPAGSNLGRYITERQDSTGLARYAAELAKQEKAKKKVDCTEKCKDDPNPDACIKECNSKKIDTGKMEISACAAPTNPPASFFSDPEFTELQRFVTVTPEGRVFTHVAGFDECHIGYRQQCISIELIADCSNALGITPFEYAKPGRVQCDDGTFVNTGPIAIKGGHADSGMALRKVMAHYDDPSSVVADVTYGMDQFGIWASGAIRPTATPDDIRTLLASGVSLDAREIDGKLRFLACCAVNTPGYPKMQTRLVASADGTESDARVTVLIAPSAPEPHITDDVCDEISA